jgi:hypothetical protein
VAIVVTAGSLSVLVAAGVHSPLRVVLALGFLLVCPGLAVLSLVGLPGAWDRYSAAIALSIALDTVVAGARIYAGAWSSGGALAILVAITLTATAANLVRRAGAT